MEPRLWLVEEVVLLSLGAHAHYLRPVAKIAARAYPRGPRGVEPVEPVLDRWPSDGIGTTFMTP